MRILIVSDLHYSLKQFDWLCLAAGEFDLLFIAGDLLDIAGHVDLDTQIVVVERYLDRISETTPLAVCSGNHDVDAETDGGERRAEWLGHLGTPKLCVDQQGFTAGDCRISVCCWWEGQSGKDEVREFLRAEAKQRTGKWVWLYHAPPSGSKTSWNGKVFSGDPFLLELISELHPDLIFGGHIHDSPFRNEGAWFDRVDGTWVFNPGRQMSSTPSCIVLDLDTMQATWDSEMDTQTIDLRAAG